MAAVPICKLLAVAVIFAFTGVSHGQAPAKTCSTDQVSVMSQLVTCVVKEHPEYLLTILTKMDKPQSMESPDFMCSNPGMMTDLVQCFLEYVEGCMSPDVAKEVAAVMPTHDSVLKGVKFLCQHRQDFENPCVNSHIVDLTQCFSSKLQTFTSIASPLTTSGNLQDALCKALRLEEECMTSSLQDCPASVSANLMSGLLAFFPAEKCSNLANDPTLRYRPGGVH